MTGPHDPDGAHPDGGGPDGGGPDDHDHDAEGHTPDEEDETTESDVTTPTPAENKDPAITLSDQAAPSGLRNPMAAVRGVGAGALVIEAVILLLAIVPLRVLDVRHTSVAIGCVLGIAVLCILLAGTMRREWAWKAGIVPPILVIACGYFHFSLAVIGVLFLLVWLYVLSVRRTVLGRGRPHQD